MEGSSGFDILSLFGIDYSDTLVEGSGGDDKNNNILHTIRDNSRPLFVVELNEATLSSSEFSGQEHWENKLSNRVARGHEGDEIWIDISSRNVYKSKRNMEGGSPCEYFWGHYDWSSLS